MTILGVPKEYAGNESRVSIIPDAVPKLKKLGLDVVVESGAGNGSYFTDEMYRDYGAIVEGDRNALFQSSDIIGTVQHPRVEDLSQMKKGTILIGLLFPERNRELIRAAESNGIVSFSLDKLPRTTRAQSMDVLTSQSSVSGYVGAVIAAANSPKLMPMLTTAAGTVKPSRVLVLGAGVAGLMTIATSRRLGAMVTAYDVRKAAEDDVRSLGAKFLDLGIEASSTGGYARELTQEEKDEQQKLLVNAMVDSDVIITTASVPGRKAPVLISRQAVAQMRPGTLIVDLSADSGGNCELTKAGETVQLNGVSIIGVENPPSHMPVNASEMYSRNITAFLQLIVKDGTIDHSYKDELLEASMVSGPGRNE